MDPSGKSGGLVIEETPEQKGETIRSIEETLQPDKKEVSSDTIKVVSDTTSLAQELIAEASAPAKDNNKSDNVAKSVGAWDFEDYRESSARGVLCQ